MKLKKKLFQGIDRTARVALAVSLAVLTTVSVWAGYTAYVQSKANTRPTLLFRCMDFKLVEDGTIQATVRLSAENMPTFSGAAFNIEFNPYFIQPSFLDSTGKKQILVDGENRSDNKHFEEDPAMKTAKFPTLAATGGKPVSPFAEAVTDSGFKRNEVIPGKIENGTVTNGSISMYLKLDGGNNNPHNYKSEKYDKDGTQDVLQVMSVYGTSPWDKYYEDDGGGFALYINAAGEVNEKGYDAYEYDSAKKAGVGKVGNGVNLGALSFQVNPDHLTEMVTKFTGLITNPDGTTNQGDKFLIGYENTVGKDAWMISDIVENKRSEEYRENVRKPEGQDSKPNQGPWGDQNVADKNDINKWAQVVFEFIFPKVLVKADVAGGDELVVNAYQAYGTGTLSDIAATVQRYRPEITATYADASQENFIMDWGKTADGYKVYRPCKAGETPDYIECHEADKEIDQWTTNSAASGSEHTGHTTHKGWKEVTVAEYTSDKMYKGDREYMVVQDFKYTDQDDPAVKTFPIPMRVHLTVTPVNLVDVNASKLMDTYTQTEAQKFNINALTDLGLPDQAILSLSPIPGSINLTMPITTWTPNTIAGLTTNDSPATPWPTDGTTLPAAGDYALQGPTAATIIAYTEANYPWVTTDGFNKGIEAMRTVVADDAAKDIKYTAAYLKTGTNGRLWLDVTKTTEDGATSINYAANAKFRTYLPNGTMINTETAPIEFPNTMFGVTTMGQDGNADSTVEIPSIGNVAHLTYYPGEPEANLPNWPGRSSHQEDVARAINLGGWFYVSVSEETDIWSELIPVYVPPRTNYYFESADAYYNDNDGSAAQPYYNFDFTGLYAGLYPFYSTSTLPTNVVLPVGYTVTTTYDGLTGTEPGQLGEFRVKKWASAQLDPTASPAAIDPAHTEQPWDSEAIVEYGDPGDPPATPAAPMSPTDFEDTSYGSFGPVENHEPTAGTDTDYTPHTWTHTVAGLEQVHMRVQAAEWVIPSPSPTPTPTPTPSGTPTETPGPTPTPGPVEKPKESIRLIHEDGNYPDDLVSGITRSGNGEVSKVTYTIQQEGYIARQTYTLTIVNDGDTDIYGLSIDVVSGVHKPENDGYPNHFEVLIPPAAYIPAGGKTTFVVTYVYNLADLDPSTKGTTYEDELLITSNGHGVDDPLKTFIANFEVTSDALYKVTVITDPDPSVPGNLDMGSAKLIKGPQTQPTLPSGFADGDKYTGTEKPDRTIATDIYMAETKYVWIGAEPKDEYKVREVYYIDGYDQNDDPIKKPLYVHEYTDPTSKETDTTYFFEMPPKNVTVVVEFYEPILAKLRLSRLMGYAGISTDATPGSGLSSTSLGLLEKDDGKGKWEHPMRHNIRWYDNTTNIIQSDPNYQDIVCPNGHSAPKEKFTADTGNLGYVFCPDATCAYNTTSFDPTGHTINNMTPADSSRPKRPDYLMVLSDYANSTNAGETADDLTRVQLDTRLRGNSLAPDIDSVTVEFFEYDLATGITGAIINSSDTTSGKTWIGASPAPGAPTSHHTEVFEMPLSQNGEVVKKAVEIKLSCVVTQAMIDSDPELSAGDLGTTITRSFVVVIVRGAKAADVELNYGNSPKGMIYNDATLTTSTAKANAWKDFVDNNNSFVGVHTPSAAAKLTNTYWLEAWGDAWKNTASYNGDSDEYALFALLGEPFQDPGFAKLKNTIGFDVDQKDVVRTAVVELLDAAATTQADRFNGKRTPPSTTVDTVTLDLGKGDKGLVTSTEANDYINNWWQHVDENGTVTETYAVRPGVYTLTYTFPNYDGQPLTTQRKLIVLAQVGDVNADRDVSNSGSVSDVTYIKNRVTDPLGCMMTPNANAANAVPDYPAWRLFRYRSCDTNNDRNINNIDANQLLKNKSRIVPYYKPTDYLSK